MAPHYSLSRVVVREEMEKGMFACRASGTPSPESTLKIITVYFPMSFSNRKGLIDQSVLEMNKHIIYTFICNLS